MSTGKVSEAGQHPAINQYANLRESTGELTAKGFTSE
jgi:hypothetical protein